MNKLTNQLFLGLALVGYQALEGSLGRFMRHARACTAYYTGALQTAQHDFERLVIDEPENSTFLRGLADCFYAQTRFESALNYYQHVLVNSTDQREKEQLYFNSGCAQAQLQKFKDALDSFEHVVVLNKNNKRAQKNIEILKKLLDQKSQQQKDKDSSKKDKTKQNTGDNNDQQNKSKDQDKRDQNKQQGNNDQQRKNGDNNAQQKPDGANNDSSDRTRGQEQDKQRQPEHINSSESREHTAGSTDHSKNAMRQPQKQLSQPFARLLNDIDHLDQQGQHLYLQALSGQRDQEKQRRRDHDW